MSALETRARRSDSLWRNNPALVHLLGLSPLLAVSESVAIALALGLVTALVLMLASITTSAVRNPFPETWRMLWILLLMALYTSFAELLLQRYFFALTRELGIYLPLICCNFAALTHLATRPDDDTGTALAQTLRVATGYLLALLLLAGIRELLSSGTLLRDLPLLVPGSDVSAGAATKTWSRFAALQPAGFILLGLLIAAKNLVTKSKADDLSPPGPVTPIPRARVTGRAKKLAQVDADQA